MTKGKIKPSAGFKTQATFAIISIAVFVVTYLVILLLSVGLTVLGIYGGIMLIAFKPMPVTIILGIGLASLGILVLFFLVKFIFSSHKVDRSHLHEISKTDEPKLFKLIEDLVQEVNTSFPKKVYLSPDVNAAVFYDSSFWSMFFPIRKNLQIGMGLVNTVSISEFKGILAHEFGHFSQKSMKLGSYVYNVNQVISNLLYDNDSYEKIIQRWANINDYFFVFVILAVKITEGIKWVLRKLYAVVNKSYLALSREMEFHADEIAASVTGFQPLKSSLLRMSLAEHAYDRVLTFYDGKVAEKVKSENIYKEQSFVMDFLAEYNDFPKVNGFPEFTAEEFNRFNKSKLVIKDQWASHPGVDERIERLENTGFASVQTDHSPANKIFHDLEGVQRELTDKVFKAVEYQGETILIPLAGFQKHFTEEFLKDTFSSIYRGYYDNKNPISFEINPDWPNDDPIQFEELFSDKKIDLVYTAIALQNDMETLKQIGENAIRLKTFDYNGRKYKRKECFALLKKLGSELEKVNSLIRDNDIKIFRFFERYENHPNNQLKELYKEFFTYDQQFDARYELFAKLSEQLQFVHSKSPLEEIGSKFIRIGGLEYKLRDEIKEMMVDHLYQDEINQEIKDNFNLYLSNRWEYFNGTEYHDENLNRLFTALNHYVFLLSRGYFLQKKKLLSYQEELIKKTHNKFASLPVN